MAFSWYDTSIGYCQGLNRLAAIALLFLDEEHAFWCLVTIVHHHLPRDYYDRSLLGSQADQVSLFHIVSFIVVPVVLSIAACSQGHSQGKGSCTNPTLGPVRVSEMLAPHYVHLTLTNYDYICTLLEPAQTIH